MNSICQVICLSVVFLVTSWSASAQLVDDMDDESKLYAQSKQVNQFFRRFNGEEDEKGNRYYSKDRQYRSAKLRKKYLDILFDESNKGISPALKAEFIRDVVDKGEASILNFHDGDWFADVLATFTMNGVSEPVTLYMELEKDHLGYKWVINRVYAPMLTSSFKRDTTRVGKFLHPLSHELDFMNLRKAFADRDSITQFTVKRFTPDHLSVFLYEVQKGNLTFRAVKEVRFHFFQVDGWYFELAQFNRPGYNTGWLISNLVKVNSESEKKLLRNFLYK